MVFKKITWCAVVCVRALQYAAMRITFQARPYSEQWNNLLNSILDKVEDGTLVTKSYKYAFFVRQKNHSNEDWVCISHEWWSIRNSAVHRPRILDTLEVKDLPRASFKTLLRLDKIILNHIDQEKIDRKNAITQELNREIDKIKENVFSSKGN